ncbi:MAG TPA: hypothetical protein DEQ02_02145 [Ruminococcaceae bacterium]|nr:hypothetical protein [Oscillospiraceae bacterium]
MPGYEEILDEMKQAYREKTGSEPADDSDVGIRMQVLASQLLALHTRADWLGRQMFALSAEGEYLDMHAGQHGTARKSAVRSAGELSFYMDEPVWYDVEIPEGTVCVTGGINPLRFVTGHAEVIPAGETRCAAVALSEEGGAYNAAAGTIVFIVNPPQVFLKVTNDAPFSGGTDAESDEELRARLSGLLSRSSNGTNPVFYENAALEHDGVDSAAAVPRARGRGTVDLYLASQGGPASAEVIASVGDELQSKKEINVDLEVKPAASQSLTAEIMVRPAEGFTLEELSPIIKQAVGGYIKDLKIGQDILLAEIGGRIYNIEGVANYRVVSPADDVIVPPHYIVRCQDVTVRSF